MQQYVIRSRPLASGFTKQTTGESSKREFVDDGHVDIIAIDNQTCRIFAWLLQLHPSIARIDGTYPPLFTLCNLRGASVANPMRAFRVILTSKDVRNTEVQRDLDVSERNQKENH